MFVGTIFFCVVFSWVFAVSAVGDEVVELPAETSIEVLPVTVNGTDIVETRKNDDLDSIEPFERVPPDADFSTKSDIINQESYEEIPILNQAPHDGIPLKSQAPHEVISPVNSAPHEVLSLSNQSPPAVLQEGLSQGPYQEIPTIHQELYEPIQTENQAPHEVIPTNRAPFDAIPEISQASYEYEVIPTVNQVPHEGVPTINQVPYGVIPSDTAFITQSESLRHNSRSPDSESLCENADFLVQILNVILPLLARNVSGNAKTAYILQILRELVKSSPDSIQDDEVIYKINDLLATLEKRGINSNMLRVGDNNSTDMDPFKSKVTFKIEIPTLTNPDCTAELLAIIKVVQSSILRLVKNPVCKAKVKTATTLPTYDINSILVNPTKHIVLDNLLPNPSTERAPYIVYTPDIDVYQTPQTNIPIPVPLENLVAPQIDQDWQTVPENSDIFINLPTERPAYVEEKSPQYEYPKNPTLPDLIETYPPNIPSYLNPREIVKSEFEVTGTPGQGFVIIDKPLSEIYLPYIKPTTESAAFIDVDTKIPTQEKFPHLPPYNDLPIEIPRPELQPTQIYHINEDSKIDTDSTPPFLVEGGDSGIVEMYPNTPPKEVVTTTVRPLLYDIDLNPEYDTPASYIVPTDLEPNNPYQYDASPDSSPVINGIPIYPRPTDKPNAGNINEPNHRNPDEKLPQDVEYIDNYYDLYPKPSMVITPKDIYPSIRPNSEELYPITNVKESTIQPFSYNVTDDDDYIDLPNSHQNINLWPWYQPQYPSMADTPKPKIDSWRPKKLVYQYPEVYDNPWQSYDTVYNPSQPLPLNPTYNNQPQYFENYIPNYVPKEDYYPVEENKPHGYMQEYKSNVPADNSPDTESSPDWRDIYFNIFHQKPKYPEGTKEITTLKPPNINIIVSNKLPLYPNNDEAPVKNDQYSGYYPIQPGSKENEVVTWQPNQPEYEIILPTKDTLPVNDKEYITIKNQPEYPRPVLPDYANIVDLPDNEKQAPKWPDIYNIINMQPKHPSQKIDITTWRPSTSVKGTPSIPESQENKYGDIITTTPSQDNFDNVVAEPQSQQDEFSYDDIQPDYSVNNQPIVIQNVPYYGPGNNFPVANEPNIDQKILLIIKENIGIIEHIIPHVHRNINVHHYIEKLKKLFNLRQITIQNYATIVSEYEKLIEYIKNLNISDEILKELLVTMTNVDKSILQGKGGKSHVIELTYLVKRPTPLVYQPYYYVKYRLPYTSFITRVEQLLIEQPYLRSDPVKLYKELIALSNVSETSPDLTKFDKEDIRKLTFNDGTLLGAKLVKGEDIDLYATLDLLRELNSDATLEDVIQLIKNARKEKITLEENINPLPSGNGIQERNFKQLQVDNDAPSNRPVTKLTSHEVINDILKRVYNLRTTSLPIDSEDVNFELKNQSQNQSNDAVDQEDSLKRIDYLRSDEEDDKSMSLVKELGNKNVLLENNLVSDRQTAPIISESQINPSLRGKLLDATINAHNFKTFDIQQPGHLDYDYSPLNPENNIDETLSFDFVNQDNPQNNPNNFNTGKLTDSFNSGLNLQGYSTPSLDANIINDANAGNYKSNGYISQRQSDSLGSKLLGATIEAHRQGLPYQETRYISQPVKTFSYRYLQQPGSISVQPYQYQYKIHHSAPVYRQKYIQHIPGSVQYLQPKIIYSDLRSLVEQGQPQEA